MTEQEIYQMAMQQLGNTANGQVLEQGYAANGIANAVASSQGIDTTGWTQEQIDRLAELQNPDNNSLNTQNLLDAIKIGSGSSVYTAPVDASQRDLTDKSQYTPMSVIQQVAQNGLDPTQGPGQYNMLTDAAYLNAGGGLANEQIGNANNVTQWAATTDYNSLMEAGSLDAARTHTMNQYATGAITAEQAQEQEDAAFTQHYGSLEHTYKDSERGGSNFLSGESYVNTTITPTDYSSLTPEQAYLQAESHNNIENEFVQIEGLGGSLFKAAVTYALTAGAGAALAPSIGGFSGIAQGAIKGGLGSGIGGVVQGNGLDLGAIAQGALTGGLMAGAGDYLQDTLNGQQSDIGGLLGEGGLLGGDLVSTDGLAGVIDKAGNFLGGNMGLPVGTEVILNADGSIMGTRAELGDALFSSAMYGGQGGLTTAVIEASPWSEMLTNAANSAPGQFVLDAATEGLLKGYNEDWRESGETGVIRDAQGNLVYENGSSLPATYTDYDYANMSDQDMFNKNYFESAVQSGMWNLDEQYMYTDAPRDPDSVLTGILPNPLEEGGVIQYPTVATENGGDNPNEGNGENPTDGNGEEGTDGEAGDGEDGAENGDLNGNDEGTESGTAAGGNTGLGGTEGNGYTQNGEWVGNENINSIMDEYGLSPPQSDNIIALQLLEAIQNEPNQELQDHLIMEYQNWTGESVTQDQVAGNSSDSALPPATGNRTDQLIGLLSNTQDAVQDLQTNTEEQLPANSENQLPPGGENQLPPNSENELPPNGGGGGGGGGGLLSLAGDDGGDNPYWTPLNPYSKVSKWRKARDRVYSDIEGLLTPTGKSPDLALSKRQMQEEGLLS